MFQRLRHTIEVLKPREVPPDEVPDIVFAEEKQEDYSKLSEIIGRTIEALIFAWVAVSVGYFVERVIPKQSKLSVGAAVGLTEAVALWIVNRLFLDLNTKVGLKMKIGEKLAPYFGHRLYQTYRILKG